MQNSQKAIPWYLSGWVLAGALFIFWPVGLLLVLGRLKMDRSFDGAAARCLQVVGWILAVGCGVVFLVGLIGLPSETDRSIAIAGITICLLLTVGGGVLISKGSKLRLKAARRRLLISLIVNERCTSIDSMASHLACSIGDAVEAVRGMVVDGFLPGYELDPDTRTVSRQTRFAATSDQAATLFTCSGCGARNQTQFEAGFAFCEYCELPYSPGAMST